MPAGMLAGVMSGMLVIERGARRVEYPSTTTQIGLAVGDVNGDGRPDILVPGGAMYLASCTP